MANTPTTSPTPSPPQNSPARFRGFRLLAVCHPDRSAAPFAARSGGIVARLTKEILPTANEKRGTISRTPRQFLFFPYNLNRLPQSKTLPSTRSSTIHACPPLLTA